MDDVLQVRDVLDHVIRYIGQTCCIEGKVIVGREFRCWIAPKDAPWDVATQESSILIQLPGFTDALRCSRFCRQAAPRGIKRAIVTGFMQESEIPEFPAKINGVSAIMCIDVDNNEIDRFPIEDIQPTAEAEAKLISEMTSMSVDERKELVDTLRWRRTQW